jgi:hypothetical protein
MCRRGTSLVRRETVGVGEKGSALVLALMAVLVMATVGSALVLIAVTETRISASVAAGVEAFYGADAAIERALVDLAALGNWDDALSGATVSTLTDGPPRGIRVYAGERIDLDEATNMLRCARRIACTNADIATVTADRPWGANNPKWQLYAWGQLGPAVGGDSGPYVVVWVADDPGETDGDPLHDGTTADNPGRGMLALTAHAYGLSGTRRAIEATITRTTGADGAGAGPPAPVHVVSWREVR